jgi:hypothetical protein
LLLHSRLVPSTTSMSWTMWDTARHTPCTDWPTHFTSNLNGPSMIILCTIPAPSVTLRHARDAIAFNKIWTSDRSLINLPWAYKVHDRSFRLPNLMNGSSSSSPLPAHAGTFSQPSTCVSLPSQPSPCLASRRLYQLRPRTRGTRKYMKEPTTRFLSMLQLRPSSLL